MNIQEYSNEFDNLCQELHQRTDQMKFLDPTLESEFEMTLAAISNLARYMYVRLRVESDEETSAG